MLSVLKKAADYESLMPRIQRIAGDGKTSDEIMRELGWTCNVTRLIQRYLVPAVAEGRIVKAIRSPGGSRVAFWIAIKATGGESQPTRG